MHMSLIAEVTHVICEHCDCHPITIQDVATAVTVVGQDSSLLIIINNLGASFQLHSNHLFKLASRLQLSKRTPLLYTIFSMIGGHR